ncbi:conserved hypothetical protein [Verticillium alfalfae VaMs.102]|uniref:Ubiquinol-cytochrome-c reductase cytochrome c1 n=1 Tax=Verticillium alfalfae (strain VaMs.102 / ATCC MYA-4576 / FGSC 10136) TaxID=526221 RepID=C9SMF1_VERA1|nr:conserved hypothetical protein [Verticillium alfalfae VaMs.102]EEY19966.1 conserved hypothetical protein [Verticillium alfalfae VaMs.102]
MGCATQAYTYVDAVSHKICIPFMFMGCHKLISPPTGPTSHMREAYQCTKEVDSVGGGKVWNEEFSYKKILEIARHLSTVGVFESQNRANAEFADPSPTQHDPVPKLESPKASTAEPVESPLTVIDASQENHQAVKGGKSASPSSATDNYGFTQATAVEECCFDFATKWFPKILRAKDWDCAVAVELTTWPKVFKENFPKLPDNALSVPQHTLRRIFAQLTELRHTSVHRLPITAGDTSRIITSALGLAEALRDTARSAVLAELIYEVEEKAKALGQNITAHKARSILELEDIDRARRELDAKECRVDLQQMVEDRECRKIIGSVLMDSLVLVVFMRNYTLRYGQRKWSKIAW